MNYLEQIFQSPSYQVSITLSIFLIFKFLRTLAVFPSILNVSSAPKIYHFIIAPLFPTYYLQNNDCLKHPNWPPTTINIFLGDPYPIQYTKLSNPFILYLINGIMDVNFSSVQLLYLQWGLKQANWCEGHSGMHPGFVYFRRQIHSDAIPAYCLNPIFKFTFRPAFYFCFHQEECQHETYITFFMHTLF